MKLIPYIILLTDKLISFNIVLREIDTKDFTMTAPTTNTKKIKPKAGVEWLHRISKHLGKTQPSFPDKSAKILELSPSQIGSFAIMDVESTEITPQFAPIEITEFAVIKYLYNRDTFEVLAENKSYTSFNEPSDLAKITAEITEITGITAADVIGHKIDWNHVNEMVADCDFIVAHNASFDKPLVAPNLTGNAKWLCSYRWVNWDTFGCPIKSQEVLVLDICHFEYSGHRAMNDVSALGHLIEKADVLKEMVAVSKESTLEVIGYLDPFGKDEVKKVLTSPTSPLGFPLELKSRWSAEANKKVYWYEAIGLTYEECESAADKLVDLVNSYHDKMGDKLIINIIPTEV